MLEDPELQALRFHKMQKVTGAKFREGRSSGAGPRMGFPTG